MTATVRDAAFEVMRGCGFDRIFANPGSTEISFLTDLPEDFAFVLALHEGSVVGMATGYALATGRPAFVNLHTTAGLGNAAGAIATARENRAPLVVVVGQQDRRHLALEPFLAGRLEGLCGDYPVWTRQPVRAQDVPGAIRRAHHEAAQHRGPAIVFVPMDDWSADFDGGLGTGVASAVVRTGTDPAEALAHLLPLLTRSAAPMLVVGAGADSRAGWDALTALAERLGAPVWQEAFGARAGFPQDHPLFAGHLPAGRAGLRAASQGHDVVLVVGASAFRQYGYEPGPLVPPGVSVAVLSADPGQLHHSAADLAVLGDPAAVCAALAAKLPRRATVETRHRPAPAAPAPVDGALSPAHVFSALAERLPREAVVVEETPSSRPDLHRLLPARSPGGFLSAAMGGLGFALPAAAGLRMGDPSRPVVAVLGDGSSLYAIQGLWSAARYECGVLFIVLSNGRYAVMDQLAARHGGKPPWPGFGEISISGLASSLGCEALHVNTRMALLAVLDEVLPSLAERTEPLVLEVSVSGD
ncbi:MAG TPA: thiamine pyrophosphate-binding protein [Actinospica sp.]|nr:thiamine pyrophosphate-binding protein [Actinospica sp.]